MEKAFLVNSVISLDYESHPQNHYYVIDTCIGCGVCKERCDYDAISMVAERPVWKMENCRFCMKCVRCGAIMYGDPTRGTEIKIPQEFRKKGSHGGSGD
ncbi:MAG: 4Fe-4S binding protein [Blautia sp.]|nr:4Fe-4S binding protein [Blautia sp.]